MKCQREYDELTEHDESGKYKHVKCPYCKSKRKERIFIRPPGCKFDKPKESSKWENESYRWGHNSEKAKQERRDAIANSHMGADPYPNIS